MHFTKHTSRNIRQRILTYPLKYFPGFQTGKSKELTSLSHCESCLCGLATGRQEKEEVWGVVNWRIVLMLDQAKHANCSTTIWHWVYMTRHLFAEDSIILTLMLSHVWHTFDHISKQAKNIHICSSLNTLPQTILVLQQYQGHSKVNTVICFYIFVTLWPKKPP